MTQVKIGKSQLRSFGLIVGAGFSIIAVWPIIFRGESPRMWALWIATALAATALTFPLLLRPVFKVWMILGEALGWVNTRIILTLVYYGLIVPMGTMLRMMGKDPMARAFDRQASTYRISRQKRPASHMQRQY
jgi:hypothetical protein